MNGRAEYTGQSALCDEREELLARLLAAEGFDYQPDEAITPRHADADSAPLSFAQQRLWFYDQFEPGNPVYNLPMAVRLAGALHAAAWAQSLDEIVRRHEVLRSSFPARAGQPVQFIAPPRPVVLPLVDLRGLAPAERERTVLRLAGEDALRPFDLATGPLLRVALLRADETQHAVLFNMHHVVSDGWSKGVLIGELSALYGSFAAGTPSPLPEPAIQYADFAVWQRRQVESAGVRAQLDYWRRQLHASPAPLEVFGGARRKSEAARAAAVETFTLPAPLVAALEALSRRAGCTLYMTLLAAFETLLQRYTGQTDILVGSPIANRNRPELEGLIGFFANTLVMRADLVGNPTFAELLDRVREVTLGASAHEDYPFDMLVQELRPESSALHMPFFQVVFALDNAPRQALKLGGLDFNVITQDEIGCGRAWVDLILFVRTSGSSVNAELQYDASLCDRRAARRMIEHFLRLLRAAAADPQRRLADMPHLTEAEQRRLLVEWNEAAHTTAPTLPLHRLFEAQVAAQPDAVALTFDGAQLTYGALNARANRVARFLRGRGVGPEALVGICVERSLEMIVGLLGILKAGGGYVPLDPAYPRERLSFMLADSGATILLAQEHLLAGLPQENVTTVCLRQLCATTSTETSENLNVAVCGEQTAYVIYTSGSTGRPKGVAVSHANVARLFAVTEPRFGFDAHDCWTMFHSFAFDFSVWELWGALLYGGRLVIPAASERDPDSFRQLLRAEQVTMLNQTPSAFRHLMHADAATGATATTLALRYVIFGGEALDTQSLAPWVARRGDETPRLVNMYGITETTVHVTYRPVTAAAVATETGSIVGRPLSDLQCYLLDTSWTLMPPGAAGEIYVGGAGLARGYLNRPDLTAERFIPNPFAAAPGARLYRTGDLARHLADGSLEYLGRIDQQVKVRGLRIELGEIEAAIGAHPAVRDAVVIAREYKADDTRLVAYIVPVAERADARRQQASDEPAAALVEKSNDPARLARELRATLKTSLPDYMIPSAFVCLDALPLTPNGKLDRKALPAPETTAQAQAHGYAAPTTPLMQTVAGAWADVLGVERVGVNDSFFDLGGHSLLAARLVWRLRDLFNIDIPLRRLFEGATVAELTDMVAAATGERAGASSLAPPIRRVARRGLLPASFAQQRFWLMDCLAPGSDAYNIPVAIRLRGRLEVTALEQCLAEIVRRHESLRTRLLEVEGRPVQLIEPASALRLQITDLQGLAAAERDAAARRLAASEARRPFELARGPLLRARLLRFSPFEHDVLLTMHHVVSDGWSAWLLTQEVAKLYPAYGAGTPSPLVEPAIQYADFAAWQREWLSGDVLAQQLAYWERQLAGVTSELKWPATNGRAANTRAVSAERCGFRVSQQVSADLRALSRGQGATLFMTLAAACQTLLYRYTGQEEIVLGTGAASRDRAETEALIGCFFNLLALNTSLAGQPSFRELLARVREVTLEAFAHQYVPFDQVLNALRLKRDADHWSPFQVLFEFQPDAPETLALPGLTLELLAGVGRAPKFDLALFVRDTAHGLVGTFEYDPHLFDADIAAGMCANFVALLEDIAADPDKPIAALSLPACPEQTELLDSFSEYIEEV